MICLFQAAVQTSNEAAARIANRDLQVEFHLRPLTFKDSVFVY